MYMRMYVCVYISSMYIVSKERKREKEGEREREKEGEKGRGREKEGEKGRERERVEPQ